MGLRIRTNVQSLTAQRHMGNSTTEVHKATERLSSGYRINRGADDAAGFAIAENLRADIRSLVQAKRNANDGVSLIEVAEGGLNEINNIMVRLRELGVQAASDTIGQRERKYLNQEYFALKDEIEEGRDLYRSRVSPEIYGSTNYFDRAIVDVVLARKGHIKSKIW